MQTILQVVCSTGESVREQIVNDVKLTDYCLKVEKEKQPGRSHGWAKVLSTRPGGRGALNMVWDANTGTLLCRVVNRGRGRPSLIVADFVEYLLTHFRRRIEVVTLIPG
jgi:hypothetical protein